MLYIIGLKNKDLCVQLRSSVLPLTVETLRCVNLEEEKWICPTCCLNDKEGSENISIYYAFIFFTNVTLGLFVDEPSLRNGQSLVGLAVIDLFIALPL